MALKGDRHEQVVDITFYMNRTSDRGYLVCHSGLASGAAMDNSNATVDVYPTASGQNVAGLLLNDVVNYDLTRQHLNQHQDQVQVGGKVALLRRGWVVTNAISGTISAAGAKAYITDNGKASTTQQSSGHQQIGRFLSKADADGYAKLEINIV